ncbi:Disease resistance protein RPP13-like protein [Drosera capensis]
MITIPEPSVSVPKSTVLEAKVLLGVQGQIKSLAAQFNVINSFLRDSEGKRDEQEVVRELMRQIHDVALEAEDVLDDFMLVVEKYKRRNFMGKFIHGINHAARLNNVASTIDGINAILQRRGRDVEQEDVVGFKDEADALLTKLITGTTKLDFVSIVGMGGLGKTTLAMKIYNDPVVSGFFHCQAWVFVSEEYNTGEVVLGITRSVMPTVDLEILAEKKDEELQDMLYRHLKGQRYLGVMDDIWKPEMLLTDEEGWELFSKKVFRGEPCLPDLMDLGKKIVRRCRGLPLSVVVMAGILAKEKSYHKWSKTIDHISSYLSEDTACVEILALSYHDLPRKLKPCFLYFAAFPEDFEVSVLQLIRLWVAEGFIQQIGDRTSEYIAEDYLETLVDRSLVQEGRLRVDGGLKTCRIHDLLRDLCISESKKEKFLETETKVSSSKSAESRCRRLSSTVALPESSCQNHPVEGIMTLVKRGLLASLTRLGLSGYQPDFYSGINNYSWELLFCMSQLENLQSPKLASQIGYSVLAKCLDPNKVPSKLTKMPLTSTLLTSGFETLGKVPHLRILKLLEDSFEPHAEVLFPEGPFPELRILYMFKVKAEAWTLMSGAVSHLQRLVVKECQFQAVQADILLELDDLKDIEVAWPSPELAVAFKVLEPIED